MGYWGSIKVRWGGTIMAFETAFTMDTSSIK
jgi:hypothetical protein